MPIAEKRKENSYEQRNKEKPKRVRHVDLCIKFPFFNKYIYIAKNFDPRQFELKGRRGADKPISFVPAENDNMETSDFSNTQNERTKYGITMW